MVCIIAISKPFNFSIGLSLVYIINEYSTRGIKNKRMIISFQFHFHFVFVFILIKCIWRWRTWCPNSCATVNFLMNSSLDDKIVYRFHCSLINFYLRICYSHNNHKYQKYFEYHIIYLTAIDFSTFLYNDSFCCH